MRHGSRGILTGWVVVAACGGDGELAYPARAPVTTMAEGSWMRMAARDDLFVGASDGEVVALDATTLAARWTHGFPAPTMTPLLTDDLVIVAGNAPLDADVGGALLPTSTTMAPTEGSPIVVAYARADGAYRWGWRLSARGSVTAAAVGPDGAIVALLESDAYLYLGAEWYPSLNAGACLTLHLAAGDGAIQAVDQVGLAGAVGPSNESHLYCDALGVDPAGGVRVAQRWSGGAFPFSIGGSRLVSHYATQSSATRELRWSSDLGIGAGALLFLDDGTALAAGAVSDGDSLDTSDVRTRIVRLDAVGGSTTFVELDGLFAISRLAFDEGGRLLVTGSASSRWRDSIDVGSVYSSTSDAGGGPLAWPGHRDLIAAAFLARYSTSGQHEWSQVEPVARGHGSTALVAIEGGSLVTLTTAREGFAPIGPATLGRLTPP